MPQWQIWWQPLVRLDTGAVVGYECLARGGPRPVAEVLRQADWRTDMELVQASLGTLRHLAPGQLLFINLSPATVEAVVRGWVSLPRVSRRVVWELSEAARVLPGESDSFVSVFDGAYALDDFGAGYSDMVRLVQWRPPWVKLDRSLVAGLAEDPSRQALVRGIVTAVSAYGGSVVLEGIERVEDARAAQTLGVPYGQGFLFGVPAAPHRAG